jgi:uncharacterized protein
MATELMRAPDLLGALADVQMQWGVRIPVRDGFCLNATLYLPSRHAAPCPVIFTLTPYIGQTYHDQALYFAAHGFPFLTVDVRGRGNSEGVFKPLVGDGKDGHDVVEWLATQPYCNGQVAMWGGSYGGFVQWLTAKEFPPHLATIVPTASPYFGVDFPIRSNIASPYLMQWLTLVSGRTSQDKIFWNNELFWGAKFRRWFESGASFKDLDSQLGNPSAVFQEWIAHPNQGSYWDAYNPTADQYAELALPILTITGIYDGDQLGALTHYRKHLEYNPAWGDQHYLLIGPWDHAGTRVPKSEFGGLRFGPASLVDLPGLHLEWYKWTMLGGPKPEFLKKKVAYYVTGAEKWRYVESLENVTASSKALYLQSTNNPTDVFRSGSLSDASPMQAAPDHYVYDPRETSSAELESEIDPSSLVDQRMIYSSVGNQLIYHSEPWETDTEISGFFRLSIWISIDQPDTDIRVRIYEIALDSSSTLLTIDSLRTRYRNSLRDAELIHADTPFLYDFTGFTFVSRLIKKGHRLRMVIGAIDSIHSQRNYNSGGVVSAESMKDARPVTVKLFHDESRPSALYVPLGQLES